MIHIQKAEKNGNEFAKDMRCLDTVIICLDPPCARALPGHRTRWFGLWHDIFRTAAFRLQRDESRALLFTSRARSSLNKSASCRRSLALGSSCIHLAHWPKSKLYLGLKDIRDDDNGWPRMQTPPPLGWPCDLFWRDINQYVFTRLEAH